MKKSLIFLGLLALGTANAQQKGAVGINTNNPKATLEIMPNVANAVATATTNEGILAPRLSKVRVANIANPVQGTLVYVLDENTTDHPNSLISSYTGSNTAVANINEKGYYFYDGGKWVKAASVLPNGTANNQVLKWNGTAWTPQTDSNNTYAGSTSIFLNGGRVFERAALTGDVTSPRNSNTVTINDGAVTGAKIASNTITPDKLAPMGATDGQVLKWNGTAWAPATDEVGSGTATTPAEPYIVPEDAIVKIGAGTTSYTVDSRTDKPNVKDQYITVNGPTGEVKINIPVASQAKGRKIIITNKTSSNVVINAGGNQAILGSESPSINKKGTGKILISDGEHWYNLINY